MKANTEGSLCPYEVRGAEKRQAADSWKRGYRVKTHHLWPGSRGNSREVPFATS